MCSRHAAHHLLSGVNVAPARSVWNTNAGLVEGPSAPSSFWLRWTRIEPAAVNAQTCGHCPSGPTPAHVPAAGDRTRQIAQRIGHIALHRRQGAALRQVEHKTIANAGHAMAPEQPRAMADAIAEFAQHVYASQSSAPVFNSTDMGHPQGPCCCANWAKRLQRAAVCCRSWHRPVAARCCTTY